MKIQGEGSSENVDLASTAALPCGQEAVGNVTFLIGMSQWEFPVDSIPRIPSGNVTYVIVGNVTFLSIAFIVCQ